MERERKQCKPPSKIAQKGDDIQVLIPMALAAYIFNHICAGLEKGTQGSVLPYSHPGKSPFKKKEVRMAVLESRQGHKIWGMLL